MPKPTALSPSSRRIGPWYLGALLIVALCVTGVVTYRAYSSSKKERATVARVIRDYVTVASYQLTNNAKMAMFTCQRLWLGEVMNDPKASDISQASLHQCANRSDGRFFIDFAKNTVRSAGAQAPAPALLAWAKDTIRTAPTEGYTRVWRVGALVAPHMPADEFIAFAIRLDDGKPVQAVGVVTKSSLDYILAEVMRLSDLLPPEFSNGAPNDYFFETRLVHGVTPVTLPGDSLFTRRRLLDASFGGFALDMRLQQAAISRIVPDGIPRDRSFELFSLFGVAGLLVLASVLLLRREAELARERAGFVSSVSHELRTPLAQIRMFSEMLLLGRVRNEADRRRALEIIDKEAHRLSHLVDNVLQVARADRGTVRVNPEETKLAPVVRETVESFAVLADARQVEFRFELQDDLIVPVDREAVRQILLNLLDNAVKYGPDGQRVVVGLALFTDAARLWIDDQGPGVPVRERARVFETFYRSQRDLDSQTTGSGIGLGVVRELAALHGGSAWVEDAPGTGARFVVEFPGATLEKVADKATDWAVA